MAEKNPTTPNCGGPRSIQDYWVQTRGADHHLSKPVHTPAGIFASLCIAGRYYARDPATLDYRLHRYKDEWHYI